MSRNLRRELAKLRGEYKDRCPECGREKPDDDEPEPRPDLTVYTDDELDELHALAVEYEALCDKVDELRNRVQERRVATNGGGI